MRAGSTPSGTRLLLKNEATGGEYRNQTGPTKAAGILALRRPHVIPWARSSAGRARESHSRGQGFESPRVHQMISWLSPPPTSLRTPLSQQLEPLHLAVGFVSAENNCLH